MSTTPPPAPSNRPSDRSSDARSRGRWRVAIATLGTLALLTGVGCGDDDPDDAAATTTTAAADGTTTGTTAGPDDSDVAAYCEASLAIETAGEPDVDFATASEEEIAEAFQGFASETMRPLVDEALAVAPAAIVEDGMTVSDALDQLIETGDPSALDSEEVGDASQRLHEFDLESCGWASVSFSTVDYAFEDLPETLEAGPTSFELHNDGAEAHELVLLRKNDGVTLSAEELIALPEEEAESMITFLGVAEPVPEDETSYLVADLEPGDYVAICFIPTGTTALDGPPADGPPHFTHGMVREITVT